MTWKVRVPRLSVTLAWTGLSALVQSQAVAVLSRFPVTADWTSPTIWTRMARGVGRAGVEEGAERISTEATLVSPATGRCRCGRCRTTGRIRLFPHGGVVQVSYRIVGISRPPMIKTAWAA